MRKEEYDAASKALANEEAARKLDGDVMGLRQRVMAVEAALRARDRYYSYFVPCFVLLDVCASFTGVFFHM